MKTTAMEALQGLPRRTARRRGRRRRGGACRHGERARGSRWLRQRRAAATAALGRSRGRARERRGGHWREGEGVREAEGSAWRRRGPPAASGEAGGGRRVLARVGHTRAVLLAGGRRRLASASWLGWPAGPLGCQVGGPGKGFSFICFLFYFSDICFDLIKNTK